MGNRCRTDYDLKQHMTFSGEDFNYQEPETNVKYVPYCIEPSVGVDRMLLAYLCDAYDEEALEDGTSRTVMRFHPALAPYKGCYFTIFQRNYQKSATEVFADLSKHFMVDYDDAGSIGKRYRRHDEIGTPFCITYDFDSV